MSNGTARRMSPEQRAGRYGRKAREIRALTFAVWGTICHICGHDGASDSDHLVPLSKGGAPLDIRNRRPAHGVRPCNECPPYPNGRPRRCNTEKGDGTIGRARAARAAVAMNTSEDW